MGACEASMSTAAAEAPVADAPLELVVAGDPHVYAEVGRSREAGKTGRETGERAWRREVTPIRADGRPFRAEPLHRPSQPLAAGQRTIGRLRGYVRAAEVV